MKKALYIVFICSVLSMGLQLYLSSRSYSLSVDKTEDSKICHINDFINCDNTLLSNYSHFAGIPVSNWGFATHLILLFLSLFLLIGWDKPSVIWFTLGVFSTLSAIASLIMLGVSIFFLKLFCPFCIVLYLLSFVVAFCIFPYAKKYLSISVLKQARVFLSCTLLVLLPISALIHLIFMNMYDIKSSQKIVKNNLMDWISAPVKKTEETALLATGPTRDKAIITLKEFADFLCFHCRNSYYTLKKFKASNPQTRIEYFSFPLDKCKDKRVSCALTKAVYCAEKQKQGWDIHGIIFENQKEFIKLRNNNQALEKIEAFGHHLKSMEWKQWHDCTTSSSSEEAVKKQIKAGEDMNITGTPAFFINEKKVQHKYFIRTIKAIQKHLTK